MLHATEALLFCGSDDLTIPHQGGSCIGMEGVKAENQRHGTRRMRSVKALKRFNSCDPCGLFTTAENPGVEVVRLGRDLGPAVVLGHERAARFTHGRTC